VESFKWDFSCQRPSRSYPWDRAVLLTLDVAGEIVVLPRLLKVVENWTYDQPAAQETSSRKESSIAEQIDSSWEYG
jgi:hypothetical protein